MVECRGFCYFLLLFSFEIKSNKEYCLRSNMIYRWQRKNENTYAHENFFRTFLVFYFFSHFHSPISWRKLYVLFFRYMLFSTRKYLLVFVRFVFQVPVFKQFNPLDWSFVNCFSSFFFFSVSQRSKNSSKTYLKTCTYLGIFSNQQLKGLYKTKFSLQRLPSNK